MGDVMAVGGQCAEGGPYVIAQHCPEVTTTLMMVGIFGGLLSLVLATWGLMRISSKAASLVILAWGGLFGALGYNFLYYAQNPPPDMSGTTGWVVCGVLFIIMAIPGILFPLVTFRYIEFARRHVEIANQHGRRLAFALFVERLHFVEHVELVHEFRVCQLRHVRARWYIQIMYFDAVDQSRGNAGFLLRTNRRRFDSFEFHT